MDSKVSEHFGSIIGSMFAALRGDDPKGDNLLLSLQNLNESMKQVSDDGFLFGQQFTFFEIFVFPAFFRFEAMESLTGVPMYSKWINSNQISNCNETQSLQRVINWYNCVNSMDSVQQMKQISTFDVLKQSYQDLRTKM